MRILPMEYRLFAEVLAWTGARVSEVLALNARSFDFDAGLVTIVTLKRRMFSIRHVPLPPQLLSRLNRYFGLVRSQADDELGSKPLWGFCRMTVWRFIKRVMAAANVIGRQACPKGLRHAFGVAALQAGVPLTLLQRWMGHSRLSTTAIYANVSGPEEMFFARRLWAAQPLHVPVALHAAL